MQKAVIIHTTGSNKLAKQLSFELSVPIHPIVAGKFSNGETDVKLTAELSGLDVILVCSTRNHHINDDLMELFLLLDACVRTRTRHRIVVLPYFAYQRSDKVETRVPMAAGVVSTTLRTLGATDIISVELHSEMVHTLLRNGFHNLKAEKAMVKYLKEDFKFFGDLDEGKWNDIYVIVAPDLGSTERAKRFSELLGIDYVLIDKQRDYSKRNTVKKSTLLTKKEYVIEGKIALVFDDMGDTMGTARKASEELVKHGVKGVFLFLVHGVFSGPAIQRIIESKDIMGVITTNTLPQDENMINCKKIACVNLAGLIAEKVTSLFLTYYLSNKLQK